MPKYIKTSDYDIIIFNETLNHSDFKHFKPISAGFIKFYIDDKGELNCQCYGDSFTLGMSSEPIEDSKLAKLQHTNW
jgi:hypothetical protein